MEFCQSKKVGTLKLLSFCLQHRSVLVAVYFANVAKIGIF